MSENFWPLRATHDFWGARGSEFVNGADGEIAAWTRFYIFESFKVRPVVLGSIESHPDFE